MMLPLAGCVTSNEYEPRPVTILPDIPSDLKLCRTGPTDFNPQKLSAGEIEKLWKRDRIRLIKVNNCYIRLQEMYVGARNRTLEVKGNL